MSTTNSQTKTTKRGRKRTTYKVGKMNDQHKVFITLNSNHSLSTIQKLLEVAYGVKYKESTIQRHIEEEPAILRGNARLTTVGADGNLGMLCKIENFTALVIQDINEIQPELVKDIKESAVRNANSRMKNFSNV